VSPHEQCRAILTHRALDSRKLVEGERSEDPQEATTSVQHQQQDDGFSRRSFLQDSLSATVLLFPAAAATSDPANAATTAVESSAGILDGIITKPANPFVQLETVGMVPKAYFEENRSIYGYTERILDGDTIRVRHVPGYSFTNQTPEPLAKRGIADDTLLIRLYGVDCPEIAKNKNQTTQPFGEEAKQFTSNLVYHQMVKVTFLRRDRYGRAIAMVETLPAGGYLLSGLPGLGTRDLTLELAREGLAELYKGGGAEYYVSDLYKVRVSISLLVSTIHSPFAC